MKESLLLAVKDIKDINQKLNYVREYLQAFILRSLHESKAFQNISFVGGTALRFLYNLPRFSEDLDFSLENKSNYHFEKWMHKLKKNFIYENYNIDLTWNNTGVVHVGWIKIRDVLKELHLSPLRDQKLSIKIEIDTQPPPGAVLERRLVQKHLLFAVMHHDLSSLMAGKIHALCTRKYLKGRDWYDLIWYLAQKPKIAPNLIQLKNALSQNQEKTEWQPKEWPAILLEKLDTINHEQLIKDIQPFLEHPADESLISKEYLTSALKKLCD